MEKIEHEELFAALAMPFDSDAIKILEKPLKSGKTLRLSYVTARTIMNRLDEVVGPADWWDEYYETKDGMKCRLSIRMPDGQVTTKEDGGGFATMADDDDNEKSAFSGSFKRAAVKFGIGRYLYQDGVPDFARDLFQGQDEVYAYPRKRLAPPAAEAGRGQPTRSAAPARPAAPARGRSNGSDQQHGPPRSGRALFAWCKGKEAPENAVDLVNEIGQAEGWPPRMIDWTPEQVEIAYTEVSGTTATNTATDEEPAY